MTLIDLLPSGVGCRLRFGIWRHGLPSPSGTVLLLHGRTEFLEKYRETIGDLTARGLDVFSFDWRGQGLSTRPLPNRQKGHVADYALFEADLDRFIQQILLPLGTPPYYLLAHSMGAHVSLRYLAGHPPLFEKAVLASAMIDLFDNPAVTRLVRILGALAHRLNLDHHYAIGQRDYRKPSHRAARCNPLTSDLGRFHAFHQTIHDNPDLALGGVTYGWLNATYRSMDTLRAPGCLEKISTPLLMVVAGADPVVSVPAQTALCRRLKNGRSVRIPAARHEILMERTPIRDRFWHLFDTFLRKRS